MSEMSETEERELRVLQRVVLPPAGSLDVVPLYVETEMERGADLDMLAAVSTGKKDTAPIMNATTASSQNSVVYGEPIVIAGEEPGDIRRQATVLAGQRVSFATYFNAFPAGYWRRWTIVDSVTLRIRIAGSATVVVYRSSATGKSHPAETLQVATTEPTSVELTLPLTQFIDGGWYWFDIVAGSKDVHLLQADWVAEVPARPKGKLSVGITTFNRPEYVVELLRSLGESEEVVAAIDTVYLVDQGTNLADQQPGFTDAVKGLGDALRVIKQGNLGGSGGFSRAMDETVSAGVSDYLLLLDDDVVVEPEGILRARTFADLVRRPTIVGGHMFSMYDRSKLHAYGETVQPYRWWWGAAPQTRVSHDFGRQGLRHTRWLHRRVDVDYNGWWMSLIPVEVIKEVGLALPVFIKWDDAEYSLRAREAGYPTVSLPGMAVWHVPWDDKNDATDWQAYYHARNRLLAALLHSPYEHGGRVVTESLEIQLQMLLSMRYSSAEIRLLALQDLLQGPEHLHRDLPTKMPELRALSAGFVDAQTKPDVEQFPAVRRRKPPSRGKDPSSPSNPVDLVLRVGLGIVRQMRPVDEKAMVRPMVSVPHQDAPWWLLSNFDSALVSTADGTKVAWHKRDAKKFREQMTRSARLHAQLLAQWPALAERYRAAAPEFNSRESWRKTFGIED